MFAAGKAVSGAAPTDAQFNYVTMLLHGDGTNGAQNNTFLDSSTNNFTITRNGNTTQGTFSPYGSNWSNYFGTSGQYLQVPDSTPLNLSGGSYTIECWVNPTGNYAGYNTLIAKRVTGGGATSWEVTLSITTGYLTFYNGTLYASTTTPVANTWSHIAAVYDGTNMNLYVNGTRALQTAVTNSNTSASVTIANFDNAEPFLGYMSNVRVTKGAALYTGTSFTVPTSPLTTTVSAGTVSLLTCQSNRFIDTSVNVATVTVTGSPSVQRFSPFSPTTAYSTSVIGGSGYFDGSGDYLTTPQNAAFNFGTGAFTVEAWVYITASNGTNQRIIGLGDGAIGGGPYTGWSFNINNNLSQINWYRYDGTETDLNASYTFKTNTWYHIVAVRNGSSNLSMFVNGSRVYNNASASLSYSNVNTNPLYVGLTYDGAGGGGNKFFNGYMSSARIVAGSAVYDPTVSTLTVPTAPLTAITGTSLLLSYTNAGILDNAMMNDLETVGNAQISTSVKKYGTGSMLFDGNGDNLSSPTTPDLNMTTGNWTIECWVYILSRTLNYPLIFGNNNGSYTTGALALVISNSDLPSYNDRFCLSVKDHLNAPTLVASSTNSSNTWYHLAVVRNGTSLVMYRDGTSVASATISSGLGFDWGKLGSRIGGGNWDGAQSYFNGYIDDLRITKGVARYTANFSVPTAAFPDKG